MSLTSTPVAKYHPVAVLLHWLLAAVLIGLFAVGLYMVDLPFSPQRLKLYNWHKWAGVVVLTLSLLRLLWLLAKRPPAWPDTVLRTMPAW